MMVSQNEVVRLLNEIKRVSDNAAKGGSGGGGTLFGGGGQYYQEVSGMVDEALQAIQGQENKLENAQSFTHEASTGMPGMGGHGSWDDQQDVGDVEEVK